MKTFRNPPENPAASPRRGFTLMELLVVITIMIALAVIIVAVTQNVRRNAVKVGDMKNLRSLAAAAMAAGDDNAGQLPAFHGTSYAPYWVVGRTKLESYGIYKEACYIPRNGVQGGPPDYDWWYKVGSDSQVPIHYVYFANDAPPGTAAWFQKGGEVEKPTKNEYRGSTPYETIIKDPSKAFARNFTDDAWYTVLWAGLVREYPGKGPVAAVVGRDNKPLGLNIIYLDGHAEWKDIVKEGSKKKVDVNQAKVRYKYRDGLNLYW